VKGDPSSVDRAYPKLRDGVLALGGEIIEAQPPLA